MRSKKFKLLLGTLIIALVVTVLPMSILANAAKPENKVVRDTKVKVAQDIKVEKVELKTEREARAIAIAAVKEEGVKFEDLKLIQAIDDTDKANPQYYFRIKSLTHVYFIEVDAVNGEVLRFVEVLQKKDDVKKPDEDDELEKDLKDAKKVAIEEFQTAMKDANKEKFKDKDKFLESNKEYKDMKKKAIEEFKKAKDKIKADRKELKQNMKEEKKQNKKDDKPINEIKYLTEKQIEEIAVKKFNNKNIDKMEIELNKDKIPPLFIVEAYDTKNKVEYELVIHATTGIILEYERALY